MRQVGQVVVRAADNIGRADDYEARLLLLLPSLILCSSPRAYIFAGEAEPKTKLQLVKSLFAPPQLTELC